MSLANQHSLRRFQVSTIINDCARKPAKIYVQVLIDCNRFIGNIRTTYPGTTVKTEEYVDLFVCLHFCCEWREETTNSRQPVYLGILKLAWTWLSMWQDSLLCYPLNWASRVAGWSASLTVDGWPREGARRPRPQLLWVKREEIAEERIAGRASKTKPPRPPTPLAQGLDPPLL